MTNLLWLLEYLDSSITLSVYNRFINVKLFLLMFLVIG